MITRHGIKIKEIKEGEGFGEKSLVEQFGKRSTSIITNTHCEFIVIMKNDYVNIIRRYDKRRQAKIDFMRDKIPYLNTISSSIIWEDIFYLIKDADYTKGTAIANENEKGNQIFLVVQGYCELEKGIIIEEKNRHHQYEPIKMKKAIAKFGPGSCLGEEILVSPDPKYNYTIRVELIFIKYKRHI